MTVAILGALAVGASLGLLGSGGSILTVPILVYVLGQPDKVAIAGSLAIVGGISLVGMIPFAARKQIDWRSVLLFGIPGMAGSAGGAHLANYVSGSVQLLLFALIMLLAAFFMFRGRPPAADGTRAQPWWRIVMDGLVVGIVTGLVGVGGGFLIVPALVLLGGLPMHLAVGTSLLIIALKSFAALIEYTGVLGALGLQLDWNVILVFTVVGAAGSFAGRLLGRRLNQGTLQKVFAGFLVVIGVFVFAQNLPGVI